MRCQRCDPILDGMIMNSSDQQSPGRLSWEEFERRVLLLVSKLLALRGEKADPELRGEASALFGYHANNVIWAMAQPPRICPRCKGLHHGWSALCYPCEKQYEQETHEAAIRADERAKVEAEVSAKLAQQQGN